MTYLFNNVEFTLRIFGMFNYEENKKILNQIFIKIINTVIVAKEASWRL